MSGSHPIFPVEPDHRLPWWQRGLVALVAVFSWIPMYLLISKVDCRTAGETMAMSCLLGPLMAGAVYTVLALRRGSAVRAVVIGSALFAVTFVALGIFVNLGAVDRGKQKRTMGDVRDLATGLESLATETGYPNITDAADLAERMGRHPRGTPLDGWGSPIEVHVRRDRYVIRSAGLCGVFETPDPWSYDGSAGTTNYRADIVFSNGRFVRFPDGAQH